MNYISSVILGRKDSVVVTRLRHWALNYGLAMVDKQTFIIIFYYETIKAVNKQLKAVRIKGYNSLSGALQVN